MEEWKRINGYNNYEINQFGHVRRIPPVGSVQVRLRKWYIQENGYASVLLSLNGKVKKRFIHRLVAETFLGPAGLGMHAAHADGNRLNNHISNIRWATPRENYDDRVKHGTSNVALNEHQVKEILQSDLPGKHLAAQYGVGRSTISNIKCGRTWKYLYKKLTITG